MARTGKGSSSGWREIKPGENPTRQCLNLLSTLIRTIKNLWENNSLL